MALRMVREAIETHMPPGALPDYNVMGSSILDENSSITVMSRSAASKMAARCAREALRN
jgi:hypothetical protein